MTDIRPFRGVHYNHELLKNWTDVICPVYDIISPQQQADLYLKNEFNFVRLEFSRELPQDTDSDNKYTRAAATMDQWLKQGVMVTDNSPAIYIHDHYFTFRGKEHKRRNMIVRVRVEEWEKMIVRPHEGTMTKPKADRLNLLYTLQANTSSIMALYEDPGKQISQVIAAAERRTPLLYLQKTGDEGHLVWAVTDAAAIKKITTALAEQPIYIADGHHRYESALNYKRQRQAATPGATGEEGFNFVMMTLLDFADPGMILPPHRLVRGVNKPTLDQLLPKLKVFFDLEEIPMKGPDVFEKLEIQLKGENDIRAAVCGLIPGQLTLLRLRRDADINSMMPHFHSEIYLGLDVSVVDHIVLEELLGLGADYSTLVNYTYDERDAVNRVLDGEFQLAFLLKPIKAVTIKAIADARDRMPKKSTYFYPKPPAGLIINRLI
jgi:uncharacterized protein (DUF1015 family)